MLVLSRKPGEQIIVGDNIRITVNRISGNRVALGVSAPDSTRVLRGELQSYAPPFVDQHEIEVEWAPIHAR